jgi:8-oxo-dGTP diphosphatase
MPIEVAVGILVNSSNHVLINQRTALQSWSGWWEFPGGKLEKNETPRQALDREIYEELGVEVIEAKQWVTRSFSYEDTDVILYFFKILKWSGDASSKEGQLLSWEFFEKIDLSRVLPPNKFVAGAINLPDHYAITNLSEMPLFLFIQQLENRIKNGTKLIQVREKELSDYEYKKFAQQILEVCRGRDVKVMINSNINLAYELSADGVQLNSGQIHTINKFPKELIIGASCHNIKDLDVAEMKGANFAVLSPINKTLSHPKASPIGWEELSKLAIKYTMPIYALGGMALGDVERAQSAGAIGIASQRDIWKN